MKEALDVWLSRFIRIPEHEEDREFLKRIWYQLQRREELYLSSMSIVRRYQRERETLRHRAHLMMSGAYLAYLDQFVALIPKNIYVLQAVESGVLFRAFFSEAAADEFLEGHMTITTEPVTVWKVPFDTCGHFDVLRKGVKDGM